MPTRTQQTNARRWVLLFLAAMVAALAAILSATTASASATVGAETRVGAFNVAGEVRVEPPHGESPGQRLGNSAAGPGIVVATGVAANAADHVLPIGPGSEKAWTVLNRVDAKGAPLPGYKGGSIFKNKDGVLPETPGVTYREWDVNPYTKGVDRGLERIVTGSDGSAYWTGDHYGTFLMFRGPTG